MLPLSHLCLLGICLHGISPDESELGGVEVAALGWASDPLAGRQVGDVVFAALDGPGLAFVAEPTAPGDWLRAMSTLHVLSRVDHPPALARLSGEAGSQVAGLWDRRHVASVAVVASGCQ
jgi:hypothetical protein